MRRRSRCPICGKWFYPHPRAGNRQRVCSDRKCQRERHRRNCSDWRGRNPDYDREGRLRGRLRPEREEGGGPGSYAPLEQIDWEAARDAVGLQGAVLAEELGEVLVTWARDAVMWKPAGITPESSKVPPPGPRDEIGRGQKPP